jgi:hypothetical protein
LHSPHFVALRSLISITPQIGHVGPFPFGH